MKATHLSLAILALLGVASAVTVQQRSTELMEETISDEYELCSVEQDLNGFDSNVEGLYEKSDVRLLDGHDAKNVLIKGHHFDKPILVVAYHPQCPHCHKMVDDFKKLATEIKNSNLKDKVELAAINMSMDGTSDDLEIEAYPTIRFYKAKNDFEKFHDIAGRHYKGFKNFLALRGFKMDENKSIAQTDQKAVEAKKTEVKTEAKAEVKVEVKTEAKKEEKKEEKKPESKPAEQKK